MTPTPRLSPSTAHQFLAFNTWSSKADALGRNRHRLLAACAAIAGSNLRKAWCTWRHYATAKAATTLLLQRACIGLTSRLLWGFNAWFSALEPGEAQLSRALSHLIFQSESVAFRTWAAYATGRYQALASLALASGAFSAVKLRRGYNTWAGFAEERLYALQQVAKAMGHMFHSRMAAGWDTWLDYQSTQDVARRAAGAMVSNGLVRGFNKWYEYSEESAEAHGILDRSFRAMRACALRRAWNTFAELLDAPPDPRLRAMAHLVKRDLARALHAWVDATELWLTMHSVLRVVTHQRCWRGFLTWKAFFIERLEQLETLRTALTAAQDGRRRAWNSWAGHLPAYRALRRAAVRMVGGRAVRGLNTWMGYVAERRRYLAAVAPFAHAAEARALRTWRVASQLVSRAMDRKAARCRSLFAGPSLKSLNKWKAVAAGGRQLRRGCSAILSLKQRRAYNTWLWQCATSREARQRAVTALRKIGPDGRMLVKALNSWKELRTEKLAMGRALYRLSHLHAARAFTTWEARAGERRAHRDKLTRVLYTLSPHGRLIRRAFNTLQAQLDAWRRLRRACARMTLITILRCLLTWRREADATPREHGVLRRWRNNRLNAGFNTWADWCVGLAVARRALRHMLSSERRRAFASWVDYTDARHVARRAAGAMVSNGLVRGFNKWYEYSEESAEAHGILDRSFRAMRACALRRAWNTFAELLDAPPDPRLRAMAHLVKRDLARALHAWVDATELWLTMLTCAAALSQHGMRRALTSWMEYAETRASVLQVLRRGIGAARDGRWRAWQRWVDVQVTGRHARRGAQRFLNYASARGWATWTEFAAERRAALVGPRRAMAHWRHIQVVYCLNRWEGYVEAQHKLRGAVATLAGSRLRAAFNTWHGTAADSAAIHHLLKAALCKFSRDGHMCSRALNAWIFRWEELTLLRRAASIFLAAGLSKAVRKWAAVRQNAVTLRIAIQRLQAVTLVHVLHTWKRAPPAGPTPQVRRAVSRFTKLPTARAFDSWTQRVEELQSLRRAASHLCHRSVAMAWRAWDAFVLEREVLAAALASLLKTSLRRGLNSWMGWVDACAVTRERIRASLTSMRSPMRAAFNQWADLPDERPAAERAMRHLAHQGLSKGWNTWCLRVEALEQMRAALAHLTGRGLVKAFGSWEAYMEERHLLLKAVTTFRESAKVFALSKWYDYATLHAATLEELRRAASAFRGPQRQAWNSWMALVDEQHYQRQALSRLLHHLESRAWQTWLHVIDAEAAQAERMRGALAALASSPLRAGMNTWLAFATERRFAILAANTFLNLGRRRGWNSWMDFAESRGHKAALVGGALAALRSSSLRRALNMWIDLGEKLEPLRRSLGLLIHNSLGRALRTWADFVSTVAVKQRILMHLCFSELGRGYRTWTGYLEEREAMRMVLTRMLKHALHGALRRWRACAEERLAKLERMRSLLYSLAGGHRCLKVLNTWKALVYEQDRALRAVSAFINGSTRRAWNKWAGSAEDTRLAKRRMQNALRLEERRALNTWKETHWEVAHARQALQHWLSVAVRAFYARWASQAPKLHRLRRALAHFVLFSAARALHAWIETVANRYILKRALAAFCHGSLRKGLNSWVAAARRRQHTAMRIRTGLRCMLQVEVRRALNSWKAARAALLPLLRAVAHWGRAPEARALRKWWESSVRRRTMRAVLHRWLHQKLSRCLIQWTARARERRKSMVHRLGAAWAHYPQRKALNSWMAYYRGQRRLKGLISSFRHCARAFNTWKDRCRRLAHVALGAPNSLRSIRVMTWRECCAWLHHIGINVSRSPPTLLRTLRAGAPYQDIVRQVSLTFWLRHKMAQIANPVSLFQCLQHFFETALVVRVVGCQRLDVRALEQGKAIEHLELLSSLREILEDTQLSPVDVISNPAVEAYSRGLTEAVLLGDAL